MSENNNFRSDVKTFFPIVALNLQSSPTVIPTGNVSTPQWVHLHLVGSDLVAEWTSIPGAVIYEIAVNDTASDSGATLFRGGLTGTTLSIPLSQGTNSELITNGGFESGTLGGWSVLYTEISNTAYSGNYSAYLISSTTRNSVLYQQVPVSPGETYDLSFWYRYMNPSSLNAFHIRVRFYDTGGSLLSTDDNNLLWSSGWYKWSYRYTAPANAANAKVEVYADGTELNALRVDDVSFMGRVIINYPVKFFAVRAIQGDGTATPYSDWIKPTRIVRTSHQSASPFAEWETPNFAVSQVGATQLTNRGLVWDGWSPEIATLTYASSSSVTLSGDYTARYTAGKLLKFTQSGAVKNFTVVSSAHSGGTTTVNLSGDSVANAAISDVFYHDRIPTDPAPPTVQLIDADMNVVSGTTTETTVYSRTIAANLLGATGGLRLYLNTKLYNGSEDTQTITIRFKLGGTTLDTFGIDIAAGLLRDNWLMFHLFNRATNAQTFSFCSLSSLMLPSVRINTSAIDTTVERVFAVTMQSTNAGAGFEKYMATLELLKV